MKNLPNVLPLMDRLHARSRASLNEIFLILPTLSCRNMRETVSKYSTITIKIGYKRINPTRENKMSKILIINLYLKFYCPLIQK